MKNNTAEHRSFWKAWMRDPSEVGAVLPSGSKLAEAMAEQVEPSAGPVVELGAGTGAITRAQLFRGVKPEQLTLIDVVPAFVRILERDFPGTRVICGDAVNLREILANAGACRPATLVSSLPLLSMSRTKREAVLAEMFACLEPKGKLVQFTYSPLPPISVRVLSTVGATGSRAERVVLNLPPAAVWTYTKNLENGGR